MVSISYKKNCGNIENLDVGERVSKSIKLYDENIGECGKEGLIDQKAQTRKEDVNKLFYTESFKMSCSAKDTTH